MFPRTEEYRDESEQQFIHERNDVGDDDVCHEQPKRHEKQRGESESRRKTEQQAHRTAPDTAFIGAGQGLSQLRVT